MNDHESNNMDSLDGMSKSQLVQLCREKKYRGFTKYKTTESLLTFIKSKEIESFEPVKKSRKNCDTNAYELLFTLMFASHCKLIRPIETIDDVMVDHPSNHIFIQYKEKYMEHLTKLPHIDILNYMRVLKTEFLKLPPLSVSNIYLCGKKEFPNIVELNQHLRKNEKKGDVYVELEDGKFIAFSIKQNKKCTKTNWSVEKLIDSQDKLKTIRKQYLIDSGYPKHLKENRDKVNALFYQDNPYFKELREMIESNKKIIIDEFKHKIYGNVQYPYEIYEFDSYSLIHLTSIHINDISFEEHLPYYYSNGIRRQCAKLFYQLKINNNVYRIEVRWKGNIHSASPQFQTHSE